MIEINVQPLMIARKIHMSSVPIAILLRTIQEDIASRLVGRKVRVLNAAPRWQASSDWAFGHDFSGLEAEIETVGLRGLELEIALKWEFPPDPRPEWQNGNREAHAWGFGIEDLEFIK